MNDLEKIINDAWENKDKVNKNSDKSLIDAINQIIEENHIKGIVIGNPINMDGTSGKSSQSASDFAKNLSKNIRFL